jgi:uncharacterized repeat protein (TIGR03803 family)
MDTSGYGIFAMRNWTIAFLAAVLACAAPASAATYRVLHSFCAKQNCTDGRYPVSAPVLDAGGNLFGTTSLGGLADAGTIYKIDRSGGASAFHRIYSFKNCNGCASGFNPQAPVILDRSGALFGTAYNGGGRGVGTLFKLVPDAADRWHLHVSHVFCSSPYCSDGSNPVSGVSYPGARGGTPYDDVTEAYGVTISGGQSRYGVLYRWTPKHGQYIARSFCAEANCADGAQPNGDVAFDDAGYACGTTRTGGTAQQGTLYCLADYDDNYWTYSFCSQADCADGASPQAGVTPDGGGNLLGTARYGGAYGQGVVYRISSQTRSLAVLYSFCALAGCADGKNPSSAVLLMNGAIYGTTARGGRYDGGTVFKIDAQGREKVLHAFCKKEGCPDGYAPQAGLVGDGNGHLYGTTTQGGRHNGGTVFEIDL